MKKNEWRSFLLVFDLGSLFADFPFFVLFFGPSAPTSSPSSSSMSSSLSSPPRMSSNKPSISSFLNFLAGFFITGGSSSSSPTFLLLDFFFPPSSSFFPLLFFTSAFFFETSASGLSWFPPPDISSEELAMSQRVKSLLVPGIRESLGIRKGCRKGFKFAIKKQIPWEGT